MDIAPLVKPPPLTLGAGNDHAIVDLPFTAIIDGRQLRGHGLSLVSAYVTGLIAATPGVPRITRLAFDFDGFTVTLMLLADLRDAGGGEVVLDFTQPTGPHLPQLRHILNAWIAGDLVSLGQTIGVAGTTPPKPAKPAAQPVRRVLQGTVMGLLALSLVAVAAGLIWQRSAVRLLPDLGTLALQGETLRATASGQIAFLDTKAPMGQVALAITTSAGDVLSLVMPCACTASTALRTGSTVLAGEPVLTLTSADAGLVAQVDIPPALAFALARGDRIELTLPSGAVIPARQTAPGLLSPLTPLSADLAGQPVEIRLIRQDGWVRARALAFRQWLIQLGRP